MFSCSPPASIHLYMKCYHYNRNYFKLQYILKENMQIHFYSVHDMKLPCKIIWETAFSSTLPYFRQSLGLESIKMR